RAAERCAGAALEPLGDVGEEEVTALARSIAAELMGAAPTSGLGAAIAHAAAAFVEVGTREARMRAHEALGIAADLMARLEAIPIDKDGSPMAGKRGAAATILRELDRHVLESGVLGSLLLLDRAASQSGAGVEALDDLYQRLSKWLLRC